MEREIITYRIKQNKNKSKKVKKKLAFYKIMQYLCITFKNNKIFNINGVTHNKKKMKTFNNIFDFAFEFAAEADKSLGRSSIVKS